MTQAELTEKLLEIAQELYELRDGERKDEDIEDDDTWTMRIEILRDELELW